MATQTETSTVSLRNGVPRSTTALKVVFGAMTLGKKGTYPYYTQASCPLLDIDQKVLSLIPFAGAEAARVHTVEDCSSVLDVLQKHGHNEIDTARVYGASEELLGQLNLQGRGIILDTKLNPRKFGPKPYSHKPDDLKRGLGDSLQALQADKVDLWYLHTPDVSFPS